MAMENGVNHHTQQLDTLKASVQSFINFTSSDQYDVPQHYRSGPCSIDKTDLEAIAISATLWMIKDDPSTLEPEKEWTQEKVDGIIQAIFHSDLVYEVAQDDWDRETHPHTFSSIAPVEEQGPAPAGKLAVTATCAIQSKKRKHDREPCPAGANGRPVFLHYYTTQGMWELKDKRSHKVALDAVNDKARNLRAVLAKSASDQEQLLHIVRVRVRNTEVLLWHMRMTLYLRNHPEEPRNLDENEVPTTKLVSLCSEIKETGSLAVQSAEALRKVEGDINEQREENRQLRNLTVKLEAARAELVDVRAALNKAESLERVRISELSDLKTQLATARKGVAAPYEYRAMNGTQGSEGSQTPAETAATYRLADLQIALNAYKKGGEDRLLSTYGTLRDEIEDTGAEPVETRKFDEFVVGENRAADIAQALMRLLAQRRSVSGAA
ncbi:hypothetical protein PRZ48_000732 [Zasmidium cellare]|uniref:Uncharacterized protein n=1 Tax=Zasmidium cellare TaxID=395010 RepID=A0ABR0F0X9_ZASCE|nr:hypothetical protein PRZ48_000732 [Zasmidium cellare]